MAAQPIAFSFTIDNFFITETRSRHEDTDFVSFTLQLRNADGTTQPSHNISKSMGNVNNGTHLVVLTFPLVLVSPGQTVLFNYSIVNAGKAPASKIVAELESIGNQLLNFVIKDALPDAKKLGTLLGGVVSVGLSVVDFFASTLEGLLTADCDGPVAVEVVTLTYDELVSMTTTFPRYLNATNHPGVKSPAGCGANSYYRVNWHIDRGPYTEFGGIPVGGVRPGNGDPPVHER